MHPAIRILLLLSLAASLPGLSLIALAVAAVVLFAGYGWLAGNAWSRLRGGLFRMRWLLGAIFVLYAGFTPGDPLLASLPGLSREGLSEGGRRALVLVDLLLMVYLLLATTSVDQLVQALRMLTAPLRVLGVSPDRIGLRLGLALEGVGDMQARLQGEVRSAGSPWDRATRVIADIEREADAPVAAMILPEQRLPRPWEWLLPIVLYVALKSWMP
ncbi:MAG: CbiQ family ECF transporter T component [Nevskiales bacterium]|nr:CbiQ family ECF transporter T component [Nevskiales bacterium]